MRAWLFMLGGMVVWTAHFFSLYAIASILLTSTLARMLTVVVTLACLAADGAILSRAGRALRSGREDDVDRWIASLAALFAAISMIAIVWQGLPALLA